MEPKKRKCSKCDNPPIPGQRYCNRCHAESVREWRKTKRPDTPEQTIRIRARQRVSMQVKRGTMKRGPCEKCGRLPTEAHHDDYAKPLQVRWLCRKHHLEEEGKTMYTEGPVSEEIYAAVEAKESACSRCKEGPAMRGQRMCRTCHAENMRKFRREVGHRKSYVRGIAEAAAHLERMGMGSAAEIVKDLMRAA